MSPDFLIDYEHELLRHRPLQIQVEAQETDH